MKKFLAAVAIAAIAFAVNATGAEARASAYCVKRVQHHYIRCNCAPVRYLRHHVRHQRYAAVYGNDIVETLPPPPPEVRYIEAPRRRVVYVQAPQQEPEVRYVPAPRPQVRYVYLRPPQRFFYRLPPPPMMYGGGYGYQNGGGYRYGNGYGYGMQNHFRLRFRQMGFQNNWQGQY